MYVCARARVYAHAVVLGHPLLRNLHRMDQVQNRAKQATHSHTRTRSIHGQMTLPFVRGSGFCRDRWGGREGEEEEEGEERESKEEEEV